MKVCPNCGNSLDESNFYVDRSKPDGLTSTCKMCRRDAQKRYRKENAGSVKQYEDARRSTAERREYSRKYQREYRRINKIRADKYDERTVARKIVNDLIASGVLKKPTVCEISGSTQNVQWHHTNYNYVLVIVALAHDVHEIIHKPSVHNSEKDDKIRKIVELIGKKRELAYEKLHEYEYIKLLNEGKI